MTPIAWRDAGPADAAALARLNSAAFLEAFAHDHPGPALLAYLEETQTTTAWAALLGEPGVAVRIGETPLGAPVGLVVLRVPARLKGAGPDDAELMRLYLLAGWQGRGEGGRQVEAALARATAAGAHRMLLAVYPQNHGARRLYERHGFAEIGETCFQLGDIAMPDLIYARALR